MPFSSDLEEILEDSFVTQFLLYPLFVCSFVLLVSSTVMLLLFGSDLKDYHMVLDFF